MPANTPRPSGTLARSLATNLLTITRIICAPSFSPSVASFQKLSPACCARSNSIPRIEDLPARIRTWSPYVAMRDFVRFLTRPSHPRVPNEDGARHARDVNTRYNLQGADDQPDLLPARVKLANARPSEPALPTRC
jgi:hypothetical protein